VEDRALFDREVSRFGVVDQGADEVGRKEVGGELNPLEGGLHGLGESGHGEGLGQSRDPFDEHMAVAEDTHQQPVDKVMLAHNHVLNLQPQPLKGSALRKHLLTDSFHIYRHRPQSSPSDLLRLPGNWPTARTPQL